MQKFLIIQTAFIGDVVLATSLSEKLHLHFPDSQIDFLVRKGNEPLLKSHPWLGTVLIWDKTVHKQWNLWKILFQIRKNKYDKVINIQRFASTGFITAFSGAQQTIGFDKNPLSLFFTKKIKHLVSKKDLPMHEVERNQLLIKDFTDEHPARPALYPSRDDYAKVQPLKQLKYLTVSPASVWFTKQFPAGQWVSFMQQISISYRIYLLGAASDYALCETIRSQVTQAQVINLSGQLSFLQSAALMKDAIMNYVNDSAPMHFASAINSPVTAVYCSTVPAFGFGPLSDKRFIVELLQTLDCRPCGLHGYTACPLGHFRCATQIEDIQLLHTLP